MNFFKTAPKNKDIFKAAEAGQLNEVKGILSKGDNVNGTNVWGETALYCASRQNHDHVVKCLLQKEADTEVRENGLSENTAAIETASRGHKETLRLLLQYGANVNAQSKTGWSALHWAIARNDLATARLLLDNQASTNVLIAENHHTPLHSASWRNHTELVQLLLKRGAKVDAQDKNGATPLWLAACEGNRESVEELVRNKANVDLCDQYGRSPLYMAGDGGHEEIVKILLHARANLETKHHSSDRTPLIAACMKNHPGVVDLLCQAKANVNASDCDDNTAIHIAANENARDAVTVLLKYSPLLSKNKEGHTALDIAKENGHFYVVISLEEYLNSQPGKAQQPAASKRRKRSQSELRHYLMTMQAVLKEIKNACHQQQEAGKEHRKNFEYIGKRLKELLAKIENMESMESVPRQEPSMKYNVADPWDAVCEIIKEMDKLSVPGVTQRDLGDKHLYYLAKKVGNRRKELGACLDMDLGEKKGKSQAENLYFLLYLNWIMLVNWRERESKTVDKKKEKLCQTLVKANMTDLVSLI